MPVNETNLLPFWAKLGDGKYPEDAHPVICHLLDVGSVALELWEHALHAGFRSWLAGGLNLTEEAAGRWLAFAIAMHDIGKVSPPFQRKSDAAVMKLAEAGYRFPPVTRTAATHGVVSAAVLPSMWQTEFGVPEAFGKKLANAVGGHHGLFAAPGTAAEACADPWQVGDVAWAQARLAIMKLLADAMGVKMSTAWSEQTSDVAWLMAVAGLTSVADWIGSMQHLFPAVGTGVNWREYIVEARKRAQKAVTELGWNGWQPPAQSRSFSELFPFITAGSERPLQQAVSHLTACLPEPTLVVIEAPMGEGKTEAAMLLADHWGATNQQRGCYFALPTMATSNQMFGRVREFLVRRFPEDRINLLLLHGRASLSEALAELIRNAEEWRTSRIASDDDKRAVGGQNVAASEWFTYRKRGLLAPYGVGTIDQALMAVLQTKHVFVRLFGLAHKTIIIDEVHAYDTYMTSLLELLLSWLRSVGASVVLLSATLPKARRRTLLEAWKKGGRVPHVSTSGGANETAAVSPASEVAYPRISWIENEVVRADHFAATRRVTLILVRRSRDLRELGERLKYALRDGGSAAVICNTVRKAQEVYCALKSCFTAGELDLFHARYPFDEREAREKRTLDRFGKHDRNGNDTTTTIRPRSVLVATQVIEQSLDLDFDLLVTEIAPIDLLLQRAGRLHRHKRLRPALLGSPEIWLVQPDLDDCGCPQWGGTGFVYDKHLLWRSWLALRGVNTVTLPDDIEPLIENVYDDRACPDDLPAAWAEAWRNSLQEQRAKRDEAEAQAQQRLIKPPHNMGPLSALTQSALDEDDPALHQAFQALTRLGPPTVSVVCLFDSPEGYRVRPDGPILDVEAEPTLQIVEAALRRSVSLSIGRIVHALNVESRVPPGWQNSSLLRHQHVIAFDDSGHAGDVAFELYLDPALGLTFRDPDNLADV